jgi:hypothetical protein
MSRDIKLSELAVRLPGLEPCMRQWQSHRAQRGSDPFDWNAFRTLQESLHAPDPGDRAPTEFYWFSAAKHIQVERVGVEQARGDSALSEPVIVLA